MKHMIRRWLGLDGALAIDAIKGKIATLSLGDGDILVLMTDQCLTEQAANTLREHVEEAINSGRRAMVLTSGIKLHVIKRGGE